MIHEIENLIDEKVKHFLNDISIDYSLNKNELIEKWQIVLHKNVSNDIKKNKKSAYQNFFACKRIELKKNDSCLSFGELSRKISQEWNKLNNDEKENYVDKIPINNNNYKFTFEELNQKKMSELRELCENIGIKKSGNKHDLIKNLLGQSSSEDNKSICTKIVHDKGQVQKELKNNINDNIDNSFEIYVSTNDQKRSDIETMVSDPTNEEELIFDDDIVSDEYESDSSEKTIEDDDMFDN